jgi:hypothetical protein
MMEDGNSVKNMLDHLRKMAGKGSDVLEGMKGLSSLHADSGQ